MKSLENKTILITGGTGSFGKKFVDTLLNSEIKFKKLIIFSRDELKQFNMDQELQGSKNYEKIRFFLGDVRDLDRLKIAFRDINFVVHAAALKQVPAAEYNPFEFVKTNIMGAQNILEASLHCPSVQKVVALSTDKASSPANLYGATKLCSDKLFIAGNNYVGERDLNFSVVRYGNVMGSRGSVIPFFLNYAKENNYLPITHPEMTRFNILLEDGVKMVTWALDNALGGEVFVPKIPSYYVTDLATAIAPYHEQKIIGIRPGEKIHEMMISDSDSYQTLDIGQYFTILPHDNSMLREHYIKNYNGRQFEGGGVYDSGSNKDFLNIDQIKELISQLS